MPSLDDYVDLTALGSTGRGQLREMAVTITTPLRLDQDVHRSKTNGAILYVAWQFGFLGADTDPL